MDTDIAIQTLQTKQRSDPKVFLDGTRKIKVCFSIMFQYEIYKYI